ncbi:MAG: hypothetical protein ACRC2H_01490 [Silanimonas sp.]
MPLYKIADTEDGEIRLVEADNNTRALRHVTDARFVVSTPDPLETARLVGEGIAVEKAVPAVPRNRPPHGAPGSAPDAGA